MYITGARSIIVCAVVRAGQVEHIRVDKRVRLNDTEIIYKSYINYGPRIDQVHLVCNAGARVYQIIEYRYLLVYTD